MDSTGMASDIPSIPGLLKRASLRISESDYAAGHRHVVLEAELLEGTRIMTLITCDHTRQQSTESWEQFRDSKVDETYEILRKLLNLWGG